MTLIILGCGDPPAPAPRQVVQNAAARNVAQEAQQKEGDDAPPGANATPSKDDNLTENPIPALEQLIEQRDAAQPADDEFARLPPPEFRQYFRDVLLRSFKKEGRQDVPRLIELLKHEKYNVRTSAASALGSQFRLVDAQQIVPTLTAALGDSSWGVRATAANSLGMFKDKAKPAVPRLIELLKSDPREDVRHAAAGAMGFIGGDPGEALPLIAALAMKKNQSYSAVESLGRLGALDELEKVAGVDDSVVRYGAVVGLALVRPTTPRVVELLGNLASDPDSSVREGAFSHFVNLDPKLPEAGSHLLRGLEDPEADVRKSALKSVEGYPIDAKKVCLSVLHILLRGEGKVWESGLLKSPIANGDRAIHAGLVDVALDGDEAEDVRELAALAISWMPNDVRKESSADLQRLMGEDSVPLSIRGLAVAYLTQLRQEPPDAKATLAAVLDSDASVDCKREVLSSVGRLGTQARDMVPRLIELTEDPDLVYRAVDALEEVAKRDVESTKTIVQAMAGFLRADGDKRKERTLVALGRLGHRSAPALPLIREASENRKNSAEIRASARNAIREIEDAVSE